eukprot:138611-Rhodomonas_salina.5
MLSARQAKEWLELRDVDQRERSGVGIAQDGRSQFRAHSKEILRLGIQIMVAASLKARTRGLVFSCSLCSVFMSISSCEAASDRTLKPTHIPRMSVRTQSDHAVGSLEFRCDCFQLSCKVLKTDSTRSNLADFSHDVLTSVDRCWKVGCWMAANRNEELGPQETKTWIRAGYYGAVDSPSLNNCFVQSNTCTLCQPSHSEPMTGWFAIIETHTVLEGKSFGAAELHC